MAYNHDDFTGSPFEQATTREAAMCEALRKFAAKHGFKFKEPLHINADGEMMLAVENPKGKGPQCGEFGTAAPIISKYHWRTGIHAHICEMSPHNGWCIMNHFEVQRMLEREEY